MRDRAASLVHSRGLFMALEVLLALVCVGLKLAGVIRNPTLPILILAALSWWLRKVGWRGTGLGRPAGWGRTLALGVGIGLAYDAVDILGITPLLHHLTGQPVHVEALGASLHGQLGALLAYLALVWVFAACGEEIAWRGYLLGRVTDLLGGHRRSVVTAVVVVSILFGIAHWQQGISGVLDGVLAGALFAGLYLASGRNLWLPIIAHGVVDTTSLVLLYLGMTPR